MGSLRELSEMSRDYGLGSRYFLLVLGILAIMLLWLFLWGRVDEPVPAPPITAAPPSASTVPTSY
ncbi:hypothetical protein [Paramagnetospirillum kuznetsovii]|uniref:hypothetical protein n=1 Tax=Paramagnetospirillum kuznetsovii TaxID=2053833 RepID=UPI0011BD9854|nr:hypothetical protein [Paramagnetospirillum kuznetsovii]